MSKINLKVPEREVLDTRMGRKCQMEQQFSGPTSPKVDPFFRKNSGWTIEFWTEISGTFGSMDRARSFQLSVGKPKQSLQPITTDPKLQ